jgi:ubiquinone/menaquinone biosynthesis C-methylase UbiE
MKNKIDYCLGKVQLNKRKKSEIEVFGDLVSYQELMSRPYFLNLKEKIFKVLKNYRLKNKNILEIGAGISEFLPIFAPDNKLTALDISKVLLSQNKVKANLVVGDAEKLPFADSSFDFVYLVGVLHHLENQRQALLEIKRVLKINGKVFISEPTQWSLNLPYYLIRRVAIKVLGVDRFLNLSACGSPDESFIDLDVVREVFGGDIKVTMHKILPLRMPPIKLLEQLFPVNFNDMLEKTPLIKNFGTIVFIQGRKQRSMYDTRLRN